MWELVTPGQEPYPTLSTLLFVESGRRPVRFGACPWCPVRCRAGCGCSERCRWSAKSAQLGLLRTKTRWTMFRYDLASAKYRCMDNQRAVVTIIPVLSGARVAHSSNIMNSVCVSKQAPTPPFCDAQFVRKEAAAAHTLQTPLPPPPSGCLHRDEASSKGVRRG